MKVVLDTNILLQSLSRKSRLRAIWESFLNEKITLIVSNSVLLEYEEIIGMKTSQNVAFNIISLIKEVVNTELVEGWYEWNAITFDADDNKFFDTAIAGRADYIVTNDSHFNVVSNIEFPIMNIISAEKFLHLITAQQ